MRQSFPAFRAAFSVALIPPFWRCRRSDRSHPLSVSKQSSTGRLTHSKPDSIPTEEELFAFFQSPDEPTELDTYQQMLATDKLLEYAEISLRTLCDLIRYQQFKELGIVHSAKEFIQLFHPDEQEDTP